MCGRFSQSKSTQDIKKRFNLERVSDDLPQLFTIAPQQNASVVLNAFPLVAGIHDRMPVILDPEDEAGWLQDSLPMNRVMAMLISFPAEKMDCYEISTRVNNPSNNETEIIKAV